MELNDRILFRHACMGIALLLIVCVTSRVFTNQNHYIKECVFILLYLNVNIGTRTILEYDPCTSSQSLTYEYCLFHLS